VKGKHHKPPYDSPDPFRYRALTLRTIEPSIFDRFSVAEAVADRGYYSGEEIVACEQAGVTVYLPKPITSGLNVKGRFGKQDFVYVAADDVYLCPAGEQLD
jgi:hypothetical protein